MRKSLGRYLLILICLLPIGCSQLSDAALVASNRASAEFAWHTSGKASAAGLPHTLKHHFGLGYIQGYADVGDGGNGAVPLFPPQCYWSPQYRTDAGREKVSAWFQGYQAGTVAAYRDGLAGSNKLPTSWIPASKHPQVHEPTAEPLNTTPQSPPIHPEVIPVPQRKPGTPEELPAVEMLESKADQVSSLFRNWPEPSASSADKLPTTDAQYFAAFRPDWKQNSNLKPKPGDSRFGVPTIPDGFTLAGSPADPLSRSQDPTQTAKDAGAVHVEYSETDEREADSTRRIWTTLIPSFFQERD
jgi:hypothetical protein